MSLKFEVSGAQIDGARDYQEDSYHISRLKGSNTEDQVLLTIVADGMGGHAAGNVASNLAVQTFSKYVTAHYPAEEIHSLLKQALTEANKAIETSIRETTALKGMGCTLIAAICVNSKLYWISVGDSHLFHISKGALYKKNADHSYGGYLDRMAAEGNEVNEQNGYSRHMLLSALTGEPIPAIDCPEEPLTLQVGDRLLLCSDGIDTLDREVILANTSGTHAAKKIAEKLLAEVLAAQAPRQDNTTVIVIDVNNSIEKEQTKPEPLTPRRKQYSELPGAFTTVPPKPSVYAKETRKRKFNWSIPFLLVSLIIVSGVWYLNQKQVAVPGLDKAVTISSESDSSSTDRGVPETVSTDHEHQQKSEIIPFHDQLSKGGNAPEMVWITAGSFEMGGTGSTPPENERPRHKVDLSEFAISRKEITVGDFSRFTGENVSANSKNKPVRNVSWYTVNKYVQWLSRQTGYQYRLPTEAEWEYAARAGTTSPYWWGHQAGTDNAVCVGCGTPLEPAAPNDAGLLTANAFGLFDTAGNVSEWVEDCYHDNYDGAPADGSAWVTDQCSERVVRGGSYLNAAKSISSSRRESVPAKHAEKHIGFRVVRDK